MKVLYITRFTYAQGTTFYCSEIYNYLFYKFLLVSCTNYDFKLMGFIFFSYYALINVPPQPPPLPPKLYAKKVMKKNSC